MPSPILVKKIWREIQIFEIFEMCSDLSEIHFLCVFDPAESDFGERT